MITYQDIKSGAVPANFTSADQVKGRPYEDVKDWDLDLTKIKLDQSAQPRESLNNDRIAEYADAMKSGDQFPPLTVFHDGSTYWLADGFHRHYAAQHAGLKYIRCYVRQGGLRDAILYSVGANAKHGLARSDEDKRRAVMRLLDDAVWSTWTDRDIAKRCHVSHPFVAKIRKAHAGVTGNASSERTYTTKHGTTATMKTAGINASRITNFRAENAHKSGGDDETKSCPQTLTAQDVESDDRAEIAVSGSYPSRTEAVAEADTIQIVFDRASNEGRALFLTRNNLTGQPKVETHDAEACKPNSNAVDPASIREDGRANVGGGDVDRSATRASSAVEVGATNSPDGAAVSASSGRPEGSERLQVHREPRNAAEPDAGQSEREEIGTERGVSPCVTAGETASNSHSSEPSSSQALTDSPVLTSSPASGTPFQTLSPSDRMKALRPNCLRPELCAGSGRQHCYSCRKAAEDEGEAA